MTAIEGMPTALQVALAACAVMAAVTFAGWLAGCSAYYLSRVTRTGAAPLANMLGLGCLLTLVAYALIFMPLIRQFGAVDVATALGYIGMHFVPFLALGAHYAWCSQSGRRLRRERLSAAWRTINELRARPRTTIARQG